MLSPVINDHALEVVRCALVASMAARLEDKQLAARAAREALPHISLSSPGSRTRPESNRCLTSTSCSTSSTPAGTCRSSGDSRPID